MAALGGGALNATPTPAAPGHEARRWIQRLAESGLRGRGGGWYSAGRKWQAVHVEGGTPVVVANGAEGEPGSVKDRWLLIHRPDAVLEGLQLAARVLGAGEAYIYLKGSFARPAAALAAALRERHGGAAVEVVRGEDTYIAGEETALLESLEGRRAWPRPKPPWPAAVGLRGRPTLVQNVETLARVPAAVADPEAFRAAETTLVSLWGDVRRPGVYEVRLGTPLRRIVEEHGGGPTDGIGMIFPAGPSAPPLAEEQADAPLDPEALRALGSGLGTAALLVIGRATCPVAMAASLAAFFEREACGQCPPCVLGTANVARLVRPLEAGGARPGDLARIGEIAGFMSGHGHCAHSRTAAAAVLGVLRRFAPAVQEHLSAGGCPRPGHGRDPFGPGSPERAAIESGVA